MKNKLNKIMLATLCLGLAFFLSCSDLPDPDDKDGATSNSSTTQSSSSAVLSFSSVVQNGNSSSSVATPSSNSTPSSSSVAVSSAGTNPSSSSATQNSSSAVVSSSSVVQSSSGGSPTAKNIWNGKADTTWFTNYKTGTTFLINTAEELAGLALLVNGSANNGTYNMSGKTIRLGADIMLNDTANWQNWVYAQYRPTNTWIPIGNGATTSFQGSFEGNGKVIRGMYYENTNSYIGLFGYVNSATIKEVGVEAFYISAKTIGGLIGYNEKGNINSCYSNGILKDSGNSQVGGLIGYNDNGKIYNSYSTSTVTGDTYSNRGGLIGAHDGDKNGEELQNSYSTSARLVGARLTAKITNSYYDSDISGPNGTSFGEPKTTEYMQSEQFVKDLGSAFKYNAGGYPLLKWQ